MEELSKWEKYRKNDLKISKNTIKIPENRPKMGPVFYVNLTKAIYVVNIDL